MAIHVSFSTNSAHLVLDIRDCSVVVLDIVEQDAAATRYPAGSGGGGGGSESDEAGVASAADRRVPAVPSARLVQAQKLRPPSEQPQAERTQRLRPMFGGHKDAFVAVGTETGDILLWHWRTGKFLATLWGHDNSGVSQVAWSASNPHMLVSCSDDQTLRVWTSPAMGAAAAQD